MMGLSFVTSVDFEDKEAFIMKQLYNYNYDTSLPATWSWPKGASSGKVEM